MALDELRAFRKWYIATNKPAMSSPETIHANAARFRAERAKQAAAAQRRAAPPAIPYVSAEDRMAGRALEGRA